MPAWGKKVSQPLRDRVAAIGAILRVDPSWLTACMAVESGGSFSPAVPNTAGNGAVGLIQFMPATAQGLGSVPVQPARALPSNADDRAKRGEVKGGPPFTRPATAPLSTTTRRAGSWRVARRRCSLLVWRDHIASAAPGPATRQGPAHTSPE